MGIGDWGLGIWGLAQSPIPNPQSPIPNPHRKDLILNLTSINNFYYSYKNLNILKIKNEEEL